MRHLHSAFSIALYPVRVWLWACVAVGFDRLVPGPGTVPCTVQTPQRALPKISVCCCLRLCVGEAGEVIFSAVIIYTADTRDRGIICVRSTIYSAWALSTVPGKAKMLSSTARTPARELRFATDHSRSETSAGLGLQLSFRANEGS